MSVEQGVHGRMLDDRLFGAASNPEAIVPSIEQFDFYSGGGIDITFLGMGEADRLGNVNVSHLAGNLIGPGGFMRSLRMPRRSFIAEHSTHKAPKCRGPMAGSQLFSPAKFTNSSTLSNASRFRRISQENMARKCCTSPSEPCSVSRPKDWN